MVTFFACFFLACFGNPNFFICTDDLCFLPGGNDGFNCRLQKSKSWQQSMTKGRTFSAICCSFAILHHKGFPGGNSLSLLKHLQRETTKRKYSIKVRQPCRLQLEMKTDISVHTKEGSVHLEKKSLQIEADSEERLKCHALSPQKNIYSGYFNVGIF